MMYNYLVYKYNGLYNDSKSLEVATFKKLAPAETDYKISVEFARKKQNYSKKTFIIKLVEVVNYRETVLKEETI